MYCIAVYYDEYIITVIVARFCMRIPDGGVLCCDVLCTQLSYEAERSSLKQEVSELRCTVLPIARRRCKTLPQLRSFPERRRCRRRGMMVRHALGQTEEQLSEREAEVDAMKLERTISEERLAKATAQLKVRRHRAPLYRQLCPFCRIIHGAAAVLAHSPAVQSARHVMYGNSRYRCCACVLSVGAGVFVGAAAGSGELQGRGGGCAWR